MKKYKRDVKVHWGWNFKRYQHILIKFQERNENRAKHGIRKDSGSEFPRTEDGSQVEGVQQDFAGKRKINYI